MKKTLLCLAALISLASVTAVRTEAVGSIDFHVPQNLGLPVNTFETESGVFVAPSGLSLYFSGNRTGGFGGTDIWVSQRATLTSAWGTPQILGITINTDASENRPRLSLDGRTMFFNSNREGSQDIFVTTRTDPTDDFGWITPTRIDEVSTGSGEVGAAYFEDPVTGVGTLYFCSDRPGGLGGFDIYQSTRNSGGTFDPPTNVRFLNSPDDEFVPMPSRDGLEIFIVSTRPGGLGSQDIWVSTRAAKSARWRIPVNVASVNSEADEFDPALSTNGSVLIFGSNRAGGSGSIDLYTATRLCTAGS